MLTEGNLKREYRAFIPACEARDIRRNLAYNLVKAGLLETFTIGRNRYIYLDSLDSLPERLAALEAKS